MSPQDLVDKVETHLLESDSTYLVGDFATAADVCVAIWILQYAGGVCELQQTKAWQTTILVHSTIQSVLTTPTSTSSDNAIVNQLTEWNIDFQKYDHVKCMTAEELVENVPIDNAETESHTKNLFLKDKKHGLFLITAKPTTQFSTRALGNLLGLTGKVNLRLADAAVLKEFLKVEPGCVGPLAIVNDLEKKVTLVLDQALLDLEKIHSHPLINTSSVVLTPTALQVYLEKAGANVVVVDFSSPESAAAPVAAAADEAKKSGQQQQKKVNKDKKQTKKGETLLALQWKKEENFAMWYSDVIVLSEMISYYDISGCYILRPWSYKIWEIMQEWFNVEVRCASLGGTATHERERHEWGRG